MKAEHRTKSYASVEEMLIGEGMPKRLIESFRKLLKRDRDIARDFRSGASVRRLARKYSVPADGIESVLRVEMLISGKASR